ncbi:MAG: hypothetical protein IPH71_05795 [Proteobacteria bacterium]|nr:hypothetical protein [Pseudomonadota bacterium]
MDRTGHRRAPEIDGPVRVRATAGGEGLQWSQGNGGPSGRADWRRRVNLARACGVLGYGVNAPVRN